MSRPRPTRSTSRRAWRLRPAAALAALLALAPTSAAPETAAAGAPGRDAPASFEDVMRSPDDPEVNLRYARWQVEQGDLKGAAATLQRILLVDPELPKLRLLLAAVSYRLGDLDGAERELQWALDGPIGAADREEAEALRVRIARARRPTRYSAMLAVGAQYDDNRNAHPGHQDVLFSDLDVALSGDRQDDFAALGVVDLEAVHDLEGQGGHQLFARFESYNARQLDLHQFDLDSATLGLGASLRMPWFELSPSVTGSLLFLADDTYLMSAGARLEARRALSRRLELTGVLRFDEQDFDDVTVSPLAGDRTGPALQLELGGDYALLPAHRFGALARLTRKWANESYEAFLGPGGELRYTWLPGRGQFVLVSAAGDYLDYDGDFPFVSVKDRHTGRLRGQLTWGLPIGQLLHVAALDETFVSLRGGYYRQLSNLPNYRYGDWTGAILLSHRLDF